MADERPLKFDNGLGLDETIALGKALMSVRAAILEVEALGRHRSYSCAVTKLDEARHWLLDRKSRTA